MEVNVPTTELRIKEVIRETVEAKSFILESEGAPLSYKPGQFLTFLFTSATGQPIRRSYSISSTPALNEPLTITVKRVINGEFSRQLINKKEVGDKLITIGASGFFILPDNTESYDQFIFFAAGSGISPIFSLIKTLLHDYPGKNLLLIFSNTNKASTIFYKRLEELGRRHDNFQVEFLFSQLPDLTHSRLNTETLEVLLNKYGLRSLPLIYICGPPAYMRMVHFKLLSLSIPQQNIKREIFQSERIIEMPAPLDRRAHTVRLTHGTDEYEIMVQYPVTILQAAKIAGIPIPYSCESGQCGTCVATCIRGNVWMANNEVLVSHELDKGMVLTCTGFPVYGPVELVF